MYCILLCIRRTFFRFLLAPFEGVSYAWWHCLSYRYFDLNFAVSDEEQLVMLSKCDYKNLFDEKHCKQDFCRFSNPTYEIVYFTINITD